MLTKRINFVNFKKKYKKKNIEIRLKNLIKKKSDLINSLSVNYKDSYNKNLLKKFKYSKYFRIIGMGGSILGTQAIYNYLNDKIKKKFVFINNLQTAEKKFKKKGFTNLVVSKSGTTIETIVNSNILLKKEIKIFSLQKIKKTIFIF